MSDTTTAETDAKRKAVAKHDLIDSTGAKVPMEQATGIRYTVLETGDVFEYQLPGATAGSAATMLGLFGAKTKATNEASRVRQDNGSATEQLEAIDEIFEQLSKGVWREKSEGGGGSRTDRDVLAQVIVEVAGDKANPGGAMYYRDRMESEDGYVKKVLSNDAIKAAYRARVGKKGIDLAAVL